MPEPNAYLGLPDAATITPAYLTNIDPNDMSPETLYQVELKIWLQEWIDQRENVRTVSDFIDRPYTSTIRQIRSTNQTLTGEYAYNVDKWVRDQLVTRSEMGLDLFIDSIELPRPPNFDLTTMAFIETAPEFLDDQTYSSQTARDRKAVQDAAQEEANAARKAAEEQAALEEAERQAAENEEAARQEAALQATERANAEQAAREAAQSPLLTAAQAALTQAQEAVNAAQALADEEATKLADSTQPDGMPSAAPLPSLPNVAAVETPRAATGHAQAQDIEPADLAPGAQPQNEPKRDAESASTQSQKEPAPDAAAQDADTPDASDSEVNMPVTSSRMEAIRERLSQDRGSSDSSEEQSDETAKAASNKQSGEQSAASPEIRFQGFRVTKVGESEVMKCLGCQTNWSCRNCNPPPTITDLLEPIMRYANVKEDEDVIPPGASIHNWRPTSVYSSPWQDPDWFDDELAADDVRVLFGTKLGDLSTTNSTEQRARKAILTLALQDPDPRDVLFYQQHTAQLIRDWQRMEIAYSSAFLVSDKERIAISSPLAMALRRNLLMCEALLIQKHDMTMPGYDTEWEKIQRKEALESRIVEIMSLDKRLDEHRETKKADKKNGPLLSRIPILNIFFKAPETPADDVSEIVEDIDQIKTELDEEEKAAAEEARKTADKIDDNPIDSDDENADKDAAEQPQQPESEQSAQPDERSDQEGESRKED